MQEGKVEVDTRFYVDLISETASQSFSPIFNCRYPFRRLFRYLAKNGIICTCNTPKFFQLSKIVCSLKSDK